MKSELDYTYERVIQALDERNRRISKMHYMLIGLYCLILSTTVVGALL